MPASDASPPKRGPGKCKLFFLALVLVASFGRVLVRPSIYAEPPNVTVALGSSGWESEVRQNLAVHGYAHIPALLDRSVMQALRSIAEKYCYGDPRKALPLSYGGYSVPGFLNVSGFEGAHWLPEDPRLHQLLRAAFNGMGYRFASHNDVGCDFVGVWHKDVLRGKVAPYQECDVWSPDSQNERHEIYKVMFYLQDHVDDDQALKVIPGSHVERRTPWERGYTALHPRMGDAVIFDQRLSHAGNTYYNPFGAGRLFIQVGFGRANRFTDEFERGTVERQNSLQERMLKSSTPQGLSTWFADLKFSVIGGVLSALPPQLLNHFADADVKQHVSRSCSSPGGGAEQRRSEL